MASLLRSRAVALAMRCKSSSRQIISTAYTSTPGCARRWYSASSTTPATNEQATKPSLGSIKINGRDYPKDSWFNVPSNVANATSRKLHLQKDHPLAITREIIESKFPAPIFKYHNSFDPVVSTFENFDSLGFPADHPGRARSDTYYVNKDTLLRTHTSAHELELFRRNESQGYLISADVYRRDEIDRTHYPVFHQMEGMRVWDRAQVPGGDVAAAVWADFEKLPTHGVKVEDPNPFYHPERNPLQEQHHSPAEAEAISAHLKRSLELMVVEIFTRARQAARKAAEETSRKAITKAAKKAAKTKAAGEAVAQEPAMSTEPVPAVEEEPLRMRWVEAYFPFTSPSWELEVYYGGDWLEVLGCGVTQQHIYIEADQPSQLGWAFGLGLDRIAMLLFQIPDIRLFWSQDERFLSQFRGVSENPDLMKLFKPFSKYPACRKDISFWLKSTSSAAGGGLGGPNEFHENDVMEIVRGVAGDVVEDVHRADEFVHPKTGRRSLCYRINYRSLERTLKNEEINKLHSQVSEELVQRLGVEIR
ncbi:hypothetical protein MCOR02_008591 [Pyricularia oryzae]|uniref:phenylalanine--tRNA ligase n=1 Tax=Pyricularia oryzae TaxID=318829 RepID=A0A4P7NGD8_PYROR|nr:hypothetical protein MCOR02_008591 [Pyricularia oryzae]KAI6269628.1 hypothetical protein MCOR26_008631 [Pyricularia oryzae]KAI6305808.1 hypothetical protein MCOR34_008350 [Pyricularia oryzae]KAI6348702.1 hypothetical protein MCOR28_001439 [Pyricularia oryzae]KAI6509510.1 hypothetical protein MCOR13_001623 [Pyricularia oryzae]